ncbi:MAG: hypothetical protein AAF664_26485 [Planctomycetota bacterium]
MELIKRIIEYSRLESRHRLKSVDQEIRPTAEFLREVAKENDSGSSTSAYIAWIKDHQAIRRHATESEIQADVTFWYGINAFELSEDQLTALWANLPRVKAQKTLMEGHFNPKDYNGVFDLVMLATGDEREALKARAKSMELASES